MAPCGRPDFAADAGFYARRLPDADRCHGHEMIFAPDPQAAGDNPVPGLAGTLSFRADRAAASDPRHDHQTDQQSQDDGYDGSEKTTESPVAENIGKKFSHNL
jgi:hypothetical protein